MKNRILGLIIVLLTLGILSIMFVRPPEFTEDEKTIMLLDDIKSDLSRTEILEVMKVINNGKDIGSVKISDKEVIQEVVEQVLKTTPYKKESNKVFSMHYFTHIYFEDKNGEIIASIVNNTSIYRGDEYVDLNESLSSIYQWLLEKYENEFVAV